MTMAAATLANELLNLDPVDTEAAAITTLADAYAVFAAQAQAGPQTITATGVNLGKAAMSAALIGVSSPGAGAAVLTTAIQAFWAAVAGGLATSFAGAIAITPPPHSSLTAQLSSTFSTNTSTTADKPTATSAIASDMYSEAVIGGTVTYPGGPPPVFPIL